MEDFITWPVTVLAIVSISRPIFLAQLSNGNNGHQIRPNTATISYYSSPYFPTSVGWHYSLISYYSSPYVPTRVVLTVCQGIAYSLDDGDRIDAIIIDFSKAFDLVPHGRLLTKIANSGVDSRVVVWIRVFLLGRMQRVSVGGHLSEEVRVTSGAPQGSVLGTLLFQPRKRYFENYWVNYKTFWWWLCNL